MASLLPPSGLINGWYFLSFRSQFSGIYIYIYFAVFLKVICASVSIGCQIIYEHAALNFLAIPEALSGSSRLSPLVHHCSSCSSLEFRVLPFSLRPTLWRKSAARAHAVRRLTVCACVCARARPGTAQSLVGCCARL